MQNEKIQYSTSNTGFKIIIGGIFLIFGLVTLKNYVGIIFILISIAAITFSSGVEFDFNKNTVRVFTKTFGIITGKLIELKKFNRLTVRKTSKGFELYGARTTFSTSTFNTFYDVYLMSNNFEMGLLLYSCRDKKKINSFC